MGPQERIFKKEYAYELFRIAENDLTTARVLAKASEVRKETVLFHVEQSVEKALKSVLCWHGAALPVTHDLYAIVQKFEPTRLPPGGYSLHDLTPFATIRRYEEGTYILTEQDILVALRSAQELIAWARNEIGL